MPDAGAAGSDTVFGLDFGLRRLGVAIGSTVTGSANPLGTITVRDDGPDWPALERLITEWRPGRLVLGLPYNLDGSEHALKPRIQGFAQDLDRRFGLPVVLVDERLTSREAEARLREARASGLRKRRVDKEAVDAMAAAVILERFLDDQARDGGDG
jgi:putative Holliday junction resolvase